MISPVSDTDQHQKRRVESAMTIPAVIDDTLDDVMDPREMSRDQLRALGCEPMPVLKALRRLCLSCAGSSNEVLLCANVVCPLWAFRTGENPWHDRREMSEEQRVAAIERLTAARRAA